MAPMSEDEFAEKARREYAKLSDREKRRVTKTEESAEHWLSNLASRIWEGVKEVGKAVIAGIATALFG